MNAKLLALGVILVAAGATGFLVFAFYLPQSLSIDAAVGIARNYQAQLNNPDIAISEVMQFQQNFYVAYYEKSTGIGAFEMLIDYEGKIFPEYGPNMMWNLKYGMGGMMGGWRVPPSTQMPLGRDQASRIAQNYLNSVYPGTTVEDVQQFYGYYTIDAAKGGSIYGMLSVNGYTGEVWYHSWHGAYIQSREIG